jgi:uncharacterized SAM-binding protein YcdF (DUF218 family)
MILRLAAAVLLAWMLGFCWFVLTLPGPAAAMEADAAIVPTGGAGRIDRGLELIDEGEVKELFVSGVDREVTPDEFAQEFDVPSRVMDCCVTLGFAAVDTRSNASEAAMWIAERDYTSVRLVTTDWHMRRALSEFQQAISPQVTIIVDAVPARPPLEMLFAEYNKYLASVLYRNLPI